MTGGNILFFYNESSIILASLRDIAGSVPDHLNKTNITIKLLTQISWFHSVYNSYAYTIYCSLLSL